MSARKVRPEPGAAVGPDMSIRDAAAALGVSRPELCRWRALARIPADEFERRLAVLRETDRRATTSTILAMLAPVPARGQVKRALGIYRNMTPAERGQFLESVGVAL